MTTNSPQMVPTQMYGTSTLDNRLPQPAVKMRSFRAVFILVSIGLIAVVVGLTVGLLWISIYDSIVHNELALNPTSTSYSLWKKTPIPMYLKLYLYNWTNPEKFSGKFDVKPNFVEMGPYVFKEVDSKVNRVWNNNNDTVTFQQKRVWHFEASMSNGSLSDTVTNVNPVAATVVYMMRYKNALIKMMINAAMTVNHEKLTVKKTVGELLFDGYEDKLLNWTQKLNPTLVPFDKFGWFYGRNNSASNDGTFNMLRGNEDLGKLGMLREWNYSNKSKYYSPSCQPIDGSLGDLWAPVGESERVQFFAPDVCTSMQLVYNNVTVHGGISGRDYISNSEMLDNGTKVPSRSCYCNGVECVPSGVFNVSQCKFGAPAFVSLPHFYLADESYRSAIDGMKPDKDKHQFTIAIEPTTGIPLQVRARLQLNLMVQADDKINIFKGLPRTFIPVLWFSQEADLSGSLASQVKFVVILPLLGHVTLFGIAAIGLLLIAIGTGVFIRRTRRAEDGQILIPKNRSNSVDGLSR